MAKFNVGQWVEYNSDFYGGAEARKGKGIITHREGCVHHGACSGHGDSCKVYYVASQEPHSVARPYTEEELTAI